MMWPLVLLRSAFQPSTVLGSLWRANLLPVCTNSWTGLISTRGLRKTNSKGKVRLRLSLRRWEISGRTDTIITKQEETLLGSQGLLILRQLMLCSESQCARYWKRLRMSCSSNGQIRWQEIPWNAIRTFIVTTTRTKDTTSKTAGTCGIIWTSWSERENLNNSYITLVAKGARQIQNPEKMIP